MFNRMLCGACVAFAAILPVIGFSARAAETPETEYLSDVLSDRAIGITQGWGFLGLDSMVRATVIVPRPVTNLGELGLDTKAVPEDRPAPKIRIKDKEFARGIGTHANGEIIVDLGGRYETFEAEVGVQWSDGKSAGSVVFRVLVDGKPVFESGVMRENDPPRPVKVSVEGADELRLIVNDAGDGITADCADWADARLARNPAAVEDRDKEPVDIAPFARVLSWNPKVMEGTKAIRSDEMPAEDIAPYKEILPAAEKGYTIPATGELSSIGLQWDENRILRRVGVEFAEASAVPAVDSVQLQYWTGESAWQGKWQPANSTPEKIGNRLTWRFDCNEAMQGTQKVRWVFAGANRPTTVKSFSAFTRSQWQAVDLRIEPAGDGPAKPAEIEIYNGLAINSPAESAHHCSWDGSKPLKLKILACKSRPYKADRTVLRFKMDGAAFGVAVEDLIANDCVYISHANVFVARDPSPVTPEEYREKIAGRKSMLEEVREKPDQDLRHACEVIHSRVQDVHSWVPTLISLACDNRKFLVYRDGSIVFNEYQRPDDYPGASDGVHTTAANIGQWRFTPMFGDGQPAELTRHLKNGWLPMPVTTVKKNDLTFEQTTCVAPIGSVPEGKPAWYREKATGVAAYKISNRGSEPSEVRLSFKFTPERDPKTPLQFESDAQGSRELVMVKSGERILATIEKNKTDILSLKVEEPGVVLSGKLPPGGNESCMVFLLACQELKLEDVKSIYPIWINNTWTEEVEKYWKSLLEPAMQVEIPDEFLGNLIRASQVNCMLAARNQNDMQYVVPWISSVHFAYPESEANSIIRGMDMQGHAEFARRGLEFYLKESNPAGFITILVKNEAAGISSGYTLVGTGEVLWTLGEHYARTRDRDWMRKVAPDAARICRWVIRQRAKTKLLDAKGEKTPEYGLTPPGVSADWNRFAYRFFNEAQYYRGLEMAGRALDDIGDPAAAEIIADAKGYREDIARAYRVMQAKTPVVKLKNGTWAPGDPSLLGCYGNVEDFLPGEDVNRSYVYSVELGSHHLAANDVFDPASKEADWMIGHLEDVQFLRTNWLKESEPFDAFDWGGFAKMQPYYCRIAELHARRDDVKPFIRSYFNPIPALVNFEDLTFWEDMIGNRYAAGAWNKTHETGWFLGQTRIMFAAERGDDLWLAPFVTDRWLKDGQKIAVRNVPTNFGKVGYTIVSNAAKGEIEAVVRLPENCTAKNIVLRLRHPEGKPIRSVVVQGKPTTNFDPRKETVTLAPESGEIKIRAAY